MPSTTLLLRRIVGGAALALLASALALLTATSAAGGGTLSAVMTLGGALGGVVFHYLEPFRQRSTAWRIVANLAGVLGYAAIVGVSFMLGSGATAP